MILRDFHCPFLNRETAILLYSFWTKGTILADICAPIKVSHDLSQDGLEISFAHATRGKASVNSALNLKS